jgi:hypothetical protein
LFRGFLAASIIAAPYYEYDEVEAVKRSTLDKEISAGMVARYINMNYSAWLGDLRLENQKIPLYDELPPSLSTAGVIRTMFGQARTQLTGMKIYPVLREKTIGRDAERINESLCQEPLQKGDTGSPSSIKTMLDVEKYYHVHDDHPQGYTELRSVWRYNDLKPRCYYAMGPTHYQASRLIQPIFNKLVDLFPVSHTRMRFSLPNPVFQGGEQVTAAIYDYSSFTSSLTEKVSSIYIWRECIPLYLSLKYSCLYPYGRYDADM